MRKLTALCLALCLGLFPLNIPALAVTEEPASQGQISAIEDPAPNPESPTAEETPEADPAGEGTGEAAAEETAEPPAEGEEAPAEELAAETPAPTGFDAFPDVSGHWAEETLRWAYDNGLLAGFEDGTLRPDDAVLYVEALAILTRLLQAQAKDESSHYNNLDESAWYADAVKLGFYLYLTRDLDGEFDKPITRLETFHTLNTAFQLRDTMERISLAGYTDLKYCSGWERQDIGYLVQKGYIEGHNGQLEPYSNLTRAEFITILHRIIPNLGADVESLPASGGALLTGAVDLTGKTVTEPLWLDCATSELKLKDTTAKTITVLSQKIETIELGGKTHIEQLTVAGGNGNTLTFSTKDNAIVDTLIINHAGEVVVMGKVKTLLINGSDPVTINAEGIERLLPTGNSDITLNSSVPNVEVYSDSWIQGSGSVGTVTLYHGNLHDWKESFFTGKEVIVDKRDHGIEGISISGEAPKTLPVGAPLTYTVTVTNPLEREVTVYWRMDGETLQREEVKIGPNGSALQYTYPITYEKNMKTDRQLEFALMYRDLFGNQVFRYHETAVTLENYSNAYYDRDALNTVTTGYKGDYTLEWALNNDYDDATKTAWVNAKGYGSKTDYLIWVNLTYQRVNIFEGSAGSWTQIRTCLMGSGRNGHNTPVGSYTVTGFDADGWTTSTYNVHPVTNFTNATYKEMGFHSRKYNPSQTKMIDARIGFPISDGCIRMYDEDAWWIFENIPRGTAVVVY